MKPRAGSRGLWGRKLAQQLAQVGDVLLVSGKDLEDVDGPLKRGAGRLRLLVLRVPPGQLYQGQPQEGSPALAASSREGVRECVRECVEGFVSGPGPDGSDVYDHQRAVASLRHGVRRTGLDQIELTGAHVDRLEGPAPVRLGARPDQLAYRHAGPLAAVP
jgi:hypothetical protein